MKQFEITIIVDGADDITPERAKNAMLYLIGRAARRTPDARLDWLRAQVEAELYVGNGRAA